MNVTVRNVITSMRLRSRGSTGRSSSRASASSTTSCASESAFGDMDFATRDRYRNADRGARARLGPDRGRGRPDRHGDGASPRRSADDVDPSAGRSTPRSRLLPDLRRPRRARARTRRPGAARDAACGAPSSGRAATRLPRHARARHGARPRRAARCCRRRRRGGRRPARRRAPRPRPGVRPRDRARQPGGHQDARARSRCPGSTSTTACRRSCARSSSCRRCSPTRRTSRPRSAAWRSTTSANREGDLRFALLSDWLDAPTEDVARRRRAPGDRGGGHRAAQRAPRRGTRRRRPVPALPPQATLERGRGPLDGLGAQARQAPRAERAAARLDDDRHPDDRAAVVDAADRTSATSSRSTPTRACRAAPSARLVGTIAHPLNQPTFDPRSRPGRPRATASSSRGSPRRSRPSTEARSSSGSSPARPGIDPYASAVSDVYQDLFREGSYTGKGIYDVDAFERGDGRPRARERAAEPRPVRGHLRPGRAGHRHRALRRVPVALPGLGRPPASLGARRLAAPAVDPRPRPRRDGRSASRSSIPGIARWKMIDNLRRTLSPPLTLATLVAAWTLPSVSAGTVDRRSSWPRSSSRRRCPSSRGLLPRRPGHLQAQPPARRRRRPRRSPRPTWASASRSSPTRHG